MFGSLSSEEIHGGTLLSSTEGIQDIVQWERLMDAQSQDGSFLNSPASTACVFLHTGDLKCLEFLNNVLAKFGNFGMYGYGYGYGFFYVVWTLEPHLFSVYFSNLINIFLIITPILQFPACILRICWNAC